MPPVNWPIALDAGWGEKRALFVVEFRDEDHLHVGMIYPRTIGKRHAIEEEGTLSTTNTIHRLLTFVTR